MDSSRGNHSLHDIGESGVSRFLSDGNYDRFSLSGMWYDKSGVLFDDGKNLRVCKDAPGWNMGCMSGTIFLMEPLHNRKKCERNENTVMYDTCFAYCLLRLANVSIFSRQGSLCIHTTECPGKNVSLL